MSYRSIEDVLAEATRRGFRLAFFVTAVMLEMEAVRGHLVQLGSVVGRDGAVYECGVFSNLGQDWLVVVAETGAGTHPAQSIVTHAHVLFGAFEVQILVGTGGSRKTDAPLGSVVASDHVYMPYSGKYGENGFSGRPRTFQVDGRLVGLAKKIRRDKTWPSRICNPLGGCLPPVNGYPVGYPPIGLVAPIVSVEAVLADPGSELEALVADGYGDAHVVEMEGYGATYAASQERTPSILVRGISDMTQDKTPGKDAQLQPVAACHAAAFAFELLSHWGQAYSPDRPEPTEPSSLVTGGLPDRVGTGLSGETSGPPAELASTEHPPPLPPDVVLNFDEAFPEDLEARLSAIEAMLRTIVKNSSIKVTGGAPGSLRVFVSDPAGALLKFGPVALRSSVAERDGFSLRGLTEVAEYESLQKAGGQLARASAELLGWPTTLPDGESIDRPELEQLARRILASDASTTAVLGPPGAGKSALLASLGRRFGELGWPVLAIKGDLLDADIASEADLRDRLGLDELPSALLQRLARFQPVLLVLDQLDALAGYLDLRTARLSILLSLVRRLGRMDNVHIVLSSRPFEFEHDVRLKAVFAEALQLQLLAWSQVVKLLEAKGVNPAGWPQDAQEVMRSPQALATYLQLDGYRESEPFASYQAMLDRLWDGRVQAGGGDHGLLASRIAELMADEESLWLARARFDDRMIDVAALQSAGVLTTLGGSLGFTHQTLFEYALARGFARGKGLLSSYVLERQSSLFLRPKLWAALGYLRAVDINAYHTDLEAIWGATGLRRHLRLLLIDFLGQQVSPTNREAMLLERALRLPGERWQAFRALGGSPGWFSRFARTFIAESMVESEESAGRMVGVLSRAVFFATDEVVRLLRDYWLPHSSNDVRLWMVLQDSPRWTDQTVELLCIVAGRTDISTHLVDHLVGTIGVEHPEPALRLARARLDRQLVAARGEAGVLARDPKPVFDSLDERVAWSFTKDPGSPLREVINQRQGWESLPALAERAPAAFLEILWPWFEESFEALKAHETQREGRLGYALASQVSFEFGTGDNAGLPEPALLAGLRTAAEHLAGTDPDAWLVWAERLVRLDVAPAQRVVAHGFASHPQRFARPALAFLLGDSRRYMLGYLQDPTATSSALVAATSVHWPEEDVARFETALAAYRPAPPSDWTDPSERRDWANRVRRMKVALLRALPRHRLTAEARRRVEEEERRFPIQAGDGFEGARQIGSMMQAAEIAMASDESLINAFRTVPDASGWDHPRQWMVGGNIQLSREFATFAKGSPERAARLLKALTPETGTRAAAYTLDALSEEAPSGLVLDVMRDAVRRGCDSEEFRSSSSRAIGRLLERGANIDDDIILLLESWITLSQTVTTTVDDQITGRSGGDELLDTAQTRIEGREDCVHRSLLWGYGGLSIVPRGDYPILEALVRVRMAGGESDRLEETLRAYLHHHSGNVPVWDGLLRYLPGLHPADTTRRIAFLEQMLGKVPGLVGSKEAARFLAHSHWWGPEFVNGQLDRWRDAPGRAARQGYGEIVAVAALTQPALDWGQERLEQLIHGDGLDDARAGAALTAAHVWNSHKHRSATALLLTRLLSKGELGIWTAAFEFFRLTDELTPDPETLALLAAIAEHLHEAPRLEPTFVVDRLATLLPHHAMLVASLVKGLIERWRPELSDMRTGTAAAAPKLVDLAVTLHRLGPETREIGTNLFEELISIDAYTARQTLDELDNRFREHARPPRPRLPRRYKETNL